MEEAKAIRPPTGPIFTTGAHCEPVEWTDPETGKKLWRWVVVSFEDDSYMDDKYVDPADEAETRDELMNEMEMDD